MHRHLARLLVVGAVAVAVLAHSSPGPDPDTAARPARPSCGDAVLKADGSRWTCTFADEFTGSKLDTGKWLVQLTADSGFRGGGDCVVDTPENVSVSRGRLSLTTRKEAQPFTCTNPSGNYPSQHTSGMVTTHGKFSQTYGRFEIRAKFPASTVPGLHSALWLWPARPAKYGAWPASGEIDIAEQYSAYPDRAIPYIHYSTAAADPTVTNNHCLLDPTAFHSYVAEWTRSTITISFDGRTCVKNSINPLAPLSAPAPFDQPFLIALTQVLGIGGNTFTGSTPLPATTQVDYVRVWK